MQWHMCLQGEKRGYKLAVDRLGAHLAKPIAEGPLVAGQRHIATSDRLEVLSGAAGHIEHVRV
jgi:hypothetical protein